MAQRRVIADSDDDGSSAENSPEKLHLAAQPGSVDFDASIGIPSLQDGTGSTDPIFFQAVYDEHLVVGNKNPQNEQQPLILDDPLTSLPMSSSPVCESRVKRSKTMNASPLTSLTEPTASDRKVRRSRVAKDVEDLTQVTTPRNSKEETEGDPWEFPRSSASDRQINIATKFKSRNANLKTYGRSLRRSKTLGAGSSISQDLESPTQSQTEGLQLSTGLEIDAGNDHLKRSAQSEDDDLLRTLPKMKRRKRDVSFRDELLRTAPEEHSQNTVLGIAPDSGNLKSTSTTIQVPRSTSEEARHSTVMSLNTSSTRADDIPLTLLHTDVDLDFARTASSAPGPVGANDLTTSVAVIPNTLTSSQRLQYEIINTSTASSRRSPLSETVHTGDPNLKLIGGSSTVPSDIPLGALSSAMAQTPPSPVLLSSILHPSTRRRKLKRSKSMAPRPPDSLIGSTSSGKAKKLKRSKTMEGDEEGRVLQSSVDELSFEHTSPFTSSIAKSAHAKPEKDKTKRLGKEERVSDDELFGSDDVGIPRELYQPRPSLRRSKSMSVDPIAELDLHLQEARASKLKSSKRTKSIGLQPVRDSELEPSERNLSNPKSMRRSKSLVVQHPGGSTDLDLNLENLEAEAAKFSSGRKARNSHGTGNHKDGAGTVLEVSILPEVLEKNVLDGCLPLTNAGELGYSETAGNYRRVADTPVEDLASIQTVSKQPKKRGRPKKVAEIPTGEDVETAVTAFATSAEVTKTHDDETIAHAEDEDDAVSLIPAEPLPTKRRGRPKKVAEEHADSLLEVGDMGTNFSKPAAQTTPEPTSVVLREAADKMSRTGRTSHLQKRLPGSPQPSAKPAELLLANTTPPKAPTETTAPLRTPTKDLKKGTDQHSPLQSGKVPYRVGLSKRMRIAPLLKIIRK